MQRNFTRLAQVLFVYMCGAFLGGCNIINPKEKIPTYLHIDSFKFDVNPALTNTTTSHKITSVFVYYNNYAVGAFDLPCTIPVTTSGETGTGKLQIAPAIAVNGLNDIMGVYPFYQYDTSTLVSQPGKIVNYTPRTSFYSNTKITKISDFESASYFYLWVGNCPMVRVTDPAYVFEGNASGSIMLTNVGDSSIDSSTINPQLTIPYNGASFIEFDYKSEVPFYVGLQANLSNIVSTTPIFLAGISPSDHWQKFYLSTSDFANKAQATSYVFYIKAVLGPGQTQGRLLIDNIQLVTF